MNHEYVLALVFGALGSALYHSARFAVLQLQGWRQHKRWARMHAANADVAAMADAFEENYWEGEAAARTTADAERATSPAYVVGTAADGRITINVREPSFVSEEAQDAIRANGEVTGSADYGVMVAARGPVARAGKN